MSRSNPQETCQRCRWWNPGPLPECRRMPPRDDRIWPLAAADDWCGEFTPMLERGDPRD